MSSSAGDRPAPSIAFLVAGIAVALALGYLAWRGIWRSGSESGDIAVAFAAGRSWLLGHDPYAVPTLVQDFAAGGGAGMSPDHFEQLRDVWFPTTLPALAPLAVLGWSQAMLAGVALNVAASFFIAIGTVRLAGWAVVSAKGLLLIAFILAMAPLQTTIAFGQTGILATAAIVAAMLAERVERPWLAGVCYGLATVIKVQIGLPFFAYLLWRRRWAMPIAAAIVVGVFSAVAVIRMAVAQVAWADSWSANLAWLSRPGGVNDPGPLNIDRFTLLDLRYPLRSLLDSGPAVDVITVVLIGLAAVAFVLVHRGRDARPDLIALAFVAVLGLLVTYHRYYDAVLLVVPIAWACSVLWSPARWMGVLVLLFSADFLLPLQTILHEAGAAGWLPGAWTTGPLWTAVVLAQHAWALVAMAVVLLAAAVRERPRRVVESVAVVQPGGAVT